MDTIVFQVDADKIGPDLAQRIKAYFGNRRVQIIVKLDDTVADLMVPNDGPGNHDYALPYDDIARIADALDRNEPVDVMAEVKKFMDTN